MILYEDTVVIAYHKLNKYRLTQVKNETLLTMEKKQLLVKGKENAVRYYLSPKYK